MYKRKLPLSSLLSSKSHFLFGARSTGKTTLIDSIKDQENLVRFDLLKQSDFRRLSKSPEILGEVSKEKTIVIDEVQKLPSILDEVHRQLQLDPSRRFLLTGSSARKLKKGAANMLGGRAWVAELFPLCYAEIMDFNLNKYLNIGGLPQVYQSEFPHKDLEAYVSVYLREEIIAEALTRNVQAFSEFLDLVAQRQGGEINLQTFASDCGVSPNTAKAYFQILEDTLVGFSLKGFTKTKKRKALSRAKFYIFDIGVARTLAQKTSLEESSQDFGEAFESFIIQEIRAYLTYSQNKKTMYYWRTTSGIEVDLIIGKTAIEIKSTKQAKPKNLSGLKKLKEESLLENYILVSQDPLERTKDGVQMLYWKDFLDKLWGHKIDF